MSNDYKLLGSGVIATSQTPYVSPGADEQAIIKEVNIVNVSDADCWVTVWVGDSGVRTIFQLPIKASGGRLEFSSGSLTLDGDDSQAFYAQAQAADSLELTIHGDLKT